MGAERASLGFQVADWIETLLCHGPGDVEGDPIELDDEFMAVLFRAYELHPESGRRLVRRYVLSRPKGRAKSELAGALVCAEARGPVRFDHWAVKRETSPWGYQYEKGEPVGKPVRSPFIRCLATEEGQSGNTYDNVRYMLEHASEHSPDLLGAVDVGMTRTFFPGISGEIRPSTAGSASKDGGKETFAVADEIHLYALPELVQMHTTVRRNLVKRKAAEPWMLDTTTMYLPGQDSVAEAAHKYADQIASGKRKDPGFVFDHRQGSEPEHWNSDRELKASLKEAYGPAAVWMDLDRIIAEIRDPQTDEYDARRYFLNRRAERRANNWLMAYPGAWERCSFPELEMAYASPVTAGVDLALHNDTASVSVAGWAGERILTSTRVFRADASGRIDYGQVKGHIRDVVQHHQVVAVGYDPHMMEIIAQDLGDEGVPMVEVPQSPERMVPAFAQLLDIIVSGVLAHDNDPEVNTQIQSGVWRYGDRGRTLSKMKSGEHIDACYSLALAVAQLFVVAEPVDVSQFVW